jgi:hypothetical protein
MKLASLFRENKHNRSGDSSYSLSNLDILNDEGFDNFDATAHFYYEADDYTDHPYGEGSAREYHPASIELNKLIAEHDINVIGEDGDVVRTVAKGTDLMTDKAWSDKLADLVTDQLHDLKV